MKLKDEKNGANDFRSKLTYIVLEFSFSTQYATQVHSYLGRAYKNLTCM